jgi:hypothetical protein
MTRKLNNDNGLQDLKKEHQAVTWGWYKSLIYCIFGCLGAFIYIWYGIEKEVFQKSQHVPSLDRYRQV